MLSFRQSAQCGDQQIEVKSLNIANPGSYTVILPEGTYSVVASTYGRATQVFENTVVVFENDTTLPKILF